MIIKKTVNRVGNASHVVLPKDLIGSKVWVVTDQDINDLQELITTTLLYRKAYKHDQAEFVKDFEKFESYVELRLERLEKILMPDSK